MNKNNMQPPILQDLMHEQNKGVKQNIQNWVQEKDAPRRRSKSLRQCG